MLCFYERYTVKTTYSPGYYYGDTGWKVSNVTSVPVYATFRTSMSFSSENGFTYSGSGNIANNGTLYDGSSTYAIRMVKQGADPEDPNARLCQTYTRSCYYSPPSTNYQKGEYIDRIIAEDGTYPDNGRVGSTWYVKVGPAAEPTMPGVFAGLTEGNYYENNLSLSWGASTDPHGNSISYVLEVSKNGAEFQEVYSGTNNSYTYVITNSERGHTIQFRVKAVALGVSSEYRYSPTVKRNAAPSNPGAFTFPTGDTVIKRESKLVSWGHATDDQTLQASLQYEVSVSVDNGQTYTVIRNFATGNSFTYDFRNVSANKNFTSDNCYLRVRARDSFNVAGGYTISQKFKIDFPEAPTMPGTISGAATKPERSTNNLLWGASTDANDDPITYLLQFWDRNSWVTLASGLTVTSFNHTLPEVQANYNDYKYRVRATDATGRSSEFRESNTFGITQDSPPTVNTVRYSDRTTNTAQLEGEILNLGGYTITQHGFCWSTSPNPTTANSKTQQGSKSNTGTFTGTITGLSPDQTYYVRAYATNTKGTSYGPQIIVPKYYPRLAVRINGVGIGMIPEYPLDVNGDTRISGNLLVGVNIVAGGNISAAAPVSSNHVALKSNVDAVQTNLNNHAGQLMAHKDINLKLYRLNKDSNGIFTELQWKRADNTLAIKSVLSGGTSPKYTTRTETYYAANGSTVIATKTYTLTYDDDDELISEV